MNYLIDEKDDIGKGPNCVISMLHHYLDSRKTENIWFCFSDNCVGQNKNNKVQVSAQESSKSMAKVILIHMKICSSVQLPHRLVAIPAIHFRKKNFTWYKWDENLEQFYKPLVGITKNHHFQISCDGKVKGKGVCRFRKHKRIHIAFEANIDDTMPNVITPEGIRQS